jgi:hypothetical protein
LEGTLIGHVTGRLATRAAGRGRRPRRRVVAAVLLAPLLAFGAATARLFVWPAQGMPAHVSAIVMLAGPGDRLDKALQLASARRARMLVVSRGHLGYGSVCPPDPPGLKLICFDPVPASTRGESEFVSHLATRYRWRSIVLVTSRPQDTRARIRVGRCFAGQIYVVAVQQPWYDWPYQIAYEWAAMFKALIIQRAC